MAKRSPTQILLPAFPLKGRPGAWKHIPGLVPEKSESPRAPTGNLERWLVSHKETRGVLGVVWHYYWFGAREHAEAVHATSRDLLYIEWMPLFPEEEGKLALSGAQIAQRLGRPLHILLNAPSTNGKGA